MRLDVKKTFLIGFAFLSISAAWSVYNAFVPIFLEKFVTSTAVIGVIMTFDNVFGLIFQPYFGTLSDRTNSRIGKRMPYLLVGIPFAAVAMLLIPSGFLVGEAKMLAAGGARSFQYALYMMAAVIVMNFAMSMYRAPTVALMPDNTPPALRSEANGIINVMGGAGSVIAFLIGGWLFDKNIRYPFALIAAVMIAALLTLMFFYREPEKPFESDSGDADYPESSGSPHALSAENKSAPSNPRKNLIFMMLAVFFWFTGYNAVETFFTLFCTHQFGMTAGKSTALLTYFSASYLVFAFPAGFLGGKIGRKTSMTIGTLVILSVFVHISYFKNPELLAPLLIVGGMGMAMISINSYPSLVQMAGHGETGRYTGYYYAASFSASIASPILFGLISDIVGNNKPLFLYSACMHFMALLSVTAVTRSSVEVRAVPAAATEPLLHEEPLPHEEFMLHEEPLPREDEEPVTTHPDR